MKVDYCIKAITRLESNKKRYQSLQDNGIDVMDFQEGFINLIEESIAIVLSHDEKSFELILADIQWYLYDKVEKVITVDEVNIEVDTPEKLVNWIVGHYRVNK